MSLLDDDEPCLQALLQNICCIQPAIPTRPHSRVRSVGEARDTDVASLTAAGYMRGAPLLLTCVAGSASGESKALPPMAWDAQTFDIGETCVAPPRLQLHRPNATALTVSAVGGGGAPDVWMGLNARDHGLSVAPCAVGSEFLLGPAHVRVLAAPELRPASAGAQRRPSMMTSPGRKEAARRLTMGVSQLSTGARRLSQGVADAGKKMLRFRDRTSIYEFTPKTSVEKRPRGSAALRMEKLSFHEAHHVHTPLLTAPSDGDAGGDLAEPLVLGVLPHAPWPAPSVPAAEMAHAASRLPEARRGLLMDDPTAQLTAWPSTLAGAQALPPSVRGHGGGGWAGGVSEAGGEVGKELSARDGDLLAIDTSSGELLVVARAPRGIEAEDTMKPDEKLAGILGDDELGEYARGHSYVLGAPAAAPPAHGASLGNGSHSDGAASSRRVIAKVRFHGSRYWIHEELSSAPAHAATEPAGAAASSPESTAALAAAAPGSPTHRVSRTARLSSASAEGRLSLSRRRSSAAGVRRRSSAAKPPSPASCGSSLDAMLAGDDEDDDDEPPLTEGELTTLRVRVPAAEAGRHGGVALRAGGCITVGGATFRLLRAPPDARAAGEAWEACAVQLAPSILANKPRKSIFGGKRESLTAAPEPSSLLLPDWDRLQHGKIGRANNAKAKLPLPDLKARRKHATFVLEAYHRTDRPPLTAGCLWVEPHKCKPLTLLLGRHDFHTLPSHKLRLGDVFVIGHAAIRVLQATRAASADDAGASGGGSAAPLRYTLWEDCGKRYRRAEQKKKKRLIKMGLRDSSSDSDGSGDENSSDPERKVRDTSTPTIQLSVVNGPSRGRTHTHTSSGCMTIGTGAGAAFQLPTDLTIEDLHAVIHHRDDEGGTWHLSDVGSHSGTRLLVPDAGAQVDVGDVLTIGTTEISFCMRTCPPPAASSKK